MKSNLFLILIGIFISCFLACNQDKQVQTKSIQWSANIDSLLHGQFKRPPKVLSKTQIAITANSDTNFINALYELLELEWQIKMPDSIIQLIYAEVYEKSKELHYTYGENYGLTHLYYNDTFPPSYRDSMMQIMLNLAKKNKQKILQIKILGNIANLKSLMGNNAGAITPLIEGIKIAEELNRIDLQISLLHSQAILINGIDDAQALEAANKAISLSKEINDTINLYYEYGFISNIYSNQQKFSDAYNYAIKSYELAAIHKDTNQIHNLLNQLIDCCIKLKNYNKALEYAHLFLKINKTDYQIYNTIATIYKNQKKITIAISYFDTAINKCNLKLNNSNTKVRGNFNFYRNVLINALLQKIDLLMQLNNYLDAEKILPELKILIQENSKFLQDVYTNYEYNHTIAKIYLHQKKYALALTAIDSSLKKFNPNLKKFFSSSTYLLQSEIYDSLKNYEKAYHTYKAYHESIDTKSEKEIATKFIEIEAQNKEAQNKLTQEKKDIQSNYELKKQKIIRNVSIFSSLILICFAVFVYFSYKQKKKDNLMLAAEKLKSDTLLLNILPAEIADELKQTGGSSPRLYEEVTVMFTDFKNFTHYSEKFTPKELVDELNICFKAFDQIISKHKIEKIKTMGDGFIAAAGLPIPDQEHAKNMILAAIDIRDFMLTRKKEHGENTFEIRIGLHSGKVVAGIVGVKKYAYDIWGDTVNTAARMEQNGESGQINVSEATYELVKEKFNFTYRGEIEAKNKGKIKMYYVT